MNCQRPVKCGFVNNSGSVFYCYDCTNEIGEPKDDLEPPRSITVPSLFSLSGEGQSVEDNRPVAFHFPGPDGAPVTVRQPAPHRSEQEQFIGYRFTVALAFPADETRLCHCPNCRRDMEPLIRAITLFAVADYWKERDPLHILPSVPKVTVSQEGQR